MTFEKLIICNQEVLIYNENLTKWVSSPNFLNKLHFFFGTTGKGKTTFICQLILAILAEYRQKHNKKIWFYLVYGSKDYKKFKTLIDLCYKGWSKSGKIKFSVTRNFSRANEAYKLLISDEALANEYMHVWIFDDMVSELKSQKNTPFLDNLASVGRHANITTLMSSQLFKKIPSGIRTQMYSIIFFSKPSTDDLQLIHKTVTSDIVGSYDKKVWIETVSEFFRTYDKMRVTLICRNENFYCYKTPQCFIKIYDKLDQDEFKNNISVFFHTLEN